MIIKVLILVGLGGLAAFEIYTLIRDIRKIKVEKIKSREKKPPNS